MPRFFKKVDKIILLTALSSTTKTLGPKLLLNELADLDFLNSFKGGVILSDLEGEVGEVGEVGGEEGVKRFDFGTGKNLGSLSSSDAKGMFGSVVERLREGR